MFDTKIYHQFGCDCLGCHKFGCGCKYHSSRVFSIPLSQQIAEQNIYQKGYMDGRKEETERYKMRFGNMEDQEKFAKLLKEAIKPLEDLLRDIK